MKNLSDNMRGAVYMMFAMAGYVINDALMKLATQDLNLYQAIFIRGMVVIPEAIINDLLLPIPASRLM